ncbi:MAG: hypothetical protein V4644_00940 [Patescibacteria group bacterium]
MSLKADYFKDFEPRITWLEENDKYLEVFFLQIAIVEMTVDELIEYYEKWTTKLLLAKKINLKPQEYRDSQFRTGMTMGAKKNYLNFYLQDSEINSLLSKFIKLRNTAVHQLHKQNIAEFEKEIKSSQSDNYKLMYKLSEEIIKMIDKKLKTQKRAAGKLSKRP